MNNYEIIMLLFIIVLGVVCIAALVITVFELRKAHQEEAIDREERNKQIEAIQGIEHRVEVVLKGPIVVQGERPLSTENVMAQAMPEPVEVAPAEKEAVPVDGQLVALNGKKVPLMELYRELPKVEQKLFDRIDRKFDDIGASRVLRSTYQTIVKQGAETVAKLTIKKGFITLDCFMVEPELKAYSKENKQNKIKPQGIRFRIMKEADLEPAFVTLELANRKALEARFGKPVNKQGE